MVATPLAVPGGLKSPDYIQLVGWLDDGRPFLVYITSDNSALLHNWAAVWTGSGWHVTEVDTGLRTRDMEQIGPDTWRVYANREGSPDILTYLLGSGQTWTAESTISTPKEIQRIEVATRGRDPAPDPRHGAARRPGTSRSPTATSTSPGSPGRRHRVRLGPLRALRASRPVIRRWCP